MRSAQAPVPSPAPRLLAAVLAAALVACGTDDFVAVQPQIDLEALSVDFGELPVLNTRLEKIQVRNLGRAELMVEAVSIKEEDSAFFIEERPSMVIAGDEAFVVVGFKPVAQEPYGATLVIESNDPSRPVLEVELKGVGSTVAKMETDPELDFLLVCEGAGDIKRLNLRSTGTAPLILEDVRFKEGTAPEFQFVSSTRTPATVDPDGELLISIKYTPTADSPDESTGVLVLTGTDPENRTVEIPLKGKVNRAPVAVIAPPGNGAPGATMTLDGSESTDPDGHLPLTWAWTLKSSPIGSKASPSPKDEPETAVTMDLPGQYRMELVVKDSLGCVSPPTLVDLIAKPAEQLMVEVVWNNYDADIDLHMVPDGEAFFSARDCYYAAGQQSPDWGVLGDPSDDPRLDRDALTGFGPEIIAYPNPANGRYRVMAHYYSDHGSKNPATEVTLRVYQFGVLASETRKTLEKSGQQWVALTIDWPSGTITPVDELN